MDYFYYDASALVKRYIVEVGSSEVNHLFSHVAKERLRALFIGIGEVMSIIVRRHNAGQIVDERFRQASAEFKAEVVDAEDFQLEPVGDTLIRTSLDLIEKHSLNATDALVLRLALDVASALRAAGDDLVLMASDVRLLRAAQAEGLTIFNPETDTQARLDALLAEGQV